MKFFRPIIIILFFTLVCKYFILYLFEKDIVEKLIFILDENIEGDIQLDKINLRLFKDFPNIEIEGKEVKLHNKQDKMVADVEEISISINLFKLLFGKISLEKIKIANAHINFTKDESIIDVFNYKTKEKETFFSVSIGNVYVYNSDIENNGNIVYVDRGLYKTKSIRDAERIYIQGNGKLKSNYNIEFSTNTVIKIKDTLAKIEGFTKILNYNFKNEGKFSIEDKSYKNILFLLKTDFQNVKTLEYDSKNFNLSQIEKGDGFFKIELKFNKDYFNDENLHISAEIKSKNVDLKYGQDTVFRRFNSDIRYSFVKQGSMKKSSLKILNMTSELGDGGFLDISGDIVSNDDIHKINLNTNSSLFKNTNRMLFDKEFSLISRGSTSLCISKKDFSIQENKGELYFTIDDFNHDKYNLEANIVFKKGVFNCRGAVDINNQKYNINILDMDLVPYMASDKNRVLANLEILKDKFSLKSNIEFYNNKGEYIFDISKLNINTDIVPKFKQKGSLNLRNRDNQIALNSDNLYLGDSKIVFDLNKHDDTTKVSIYSEEGDLSDLFTLKGVFYLPSKLEHTSYRELKIDFDIFGEDSLVIDLNKLSFYADILEDSVIANGRIFKQKSDIIMDDFYLNIGNSDLKISENDSDVLFFTSKYLDLGLFFDDEEKKDRDEFRVTDLELPNKYINFDLKSVNYKENIFTLVEGSMRLDKNKIGDLKINSGISKGVVSVKGGFNFEHRDSLYFKGNIKCEKVRLEGLNFYIDKQNKIKDNLYGAMGLDSELKICFNEDMSINYDKTIIKNEITIEDGKLIKYKPLRSIDKYFSDNNLDEVSFDRLNTKIIIYNNQLILPKTEIPSTLGYIYISANVDFGGTSKYDVSIPMDLYLKAYWNALVSMKKNKGTDTNIKDKYQGNYKEIKIIDTGDEIKIEL